MSLSASLSSKDRFLQMQSLYRAGRYVEADQALTAALLVTPNDPNILHLSGLVCEAMGILPRATMMMIKAIEANPHWFEAEFNLARILAAQKLYPDAIALMEKLSRSYPHVPDVWEALATFYQLSGNLPESLNAWKCALKLAPERHDWRAQYLLLAKSICDWSITADNLDKLPPQAVTVLSDDPLTQRLAATNYARQKFDAIQSMPMVSWEPHARLRIGYLSSDFHSHATSYLIAELFDLHDKSKFEVFAYSYGVDDNSDIRQRIKQTAEHFIMLNNRTAQQSAVQIRSDEIDILVDLKGHTRGGKLEILAYHPARIQLHWLGYPGTLGSNFIDAFIADDVTIPLGSEKYFTERVLRLPHCYQINDRQRAVNLPASRVAYGLPEEGFVFASFNQTYKITPEMFSLWCVLLRDKPDSVLWLLQSNLYAPDYLRKAAQTNGIDPERIIFAQPMPLADHLARYAYVDLALDTFPVGGHTTTSDALWTGTPVVTMAGESFVSRVAASVLTAAGLPELITKSHNEYKKLCLELADDGAARQDIKGHLCADREALSLFDTPRFIHDWEKMLHTISTPV